MYTLLGSLFASVHRRALDVNRRAGRRRTRDGAAQDVTRAAASQPPVTASQRGVAAAMTDKKRPGDQGNEEDFRIEYKPADDGVPQLDRKTFAKSRNAVVAEWSSKGRKNYVTGFRKRKLERQQVGRAQADAKKRKERSDLRKERNRAIYGDLAALQKEWDQEAAAAPETNHRATSQTTETTEMTFGDGAVATTVSIESFDMEETEVRAAARRETIAPQLAAAPAAAAAWT